MTTTTYIFILIGVGCVSSALMKLILWLDEPKSRRRPRYAR